MRAAEHRRPELVFTPAAKVAFRLYALAPATTTRLLGPISRLLLPKAGSAPERDVSGVSIAKRQHGRLLAAARTTTNREEWEHEYGTGASLFGYTKLYGQVPGGQDEFLRVPFGDHLPIVVPQGPPDDRFVFLSDVLPTAWQAVRYAAVPGTCVPGSRGTLARTSSSASI